MLSKSIEKQESQGNVLIPEIHGMAYMFFCEVLTFNVYILDIQYIVYFGIYIFKQATRIQLIAGSRSGSGSVYNV